MKVIRHLVTNFRFMSGIISGPLVITDRIRMLVLILIISFNSLNNLKAQQDNPDFEGISVLVQVEGYGNFYTDALYSPSGSLYVSVEDLFKYLRIPCNVFEKGDVLKGFLANEDRNYTISFPSRTVEIAAKINKEDKSMIKEMGSVYLESSRFGALLGINLNFNFRSLSLIVKSDFELPVIKEKRLEKMRSNISKRPDEIVADTVLGRYNHLFRIGNLDWSVMSSQYWKRTSETRLGLGMGAELLHGEANVFLNYSDLYKFDNRLQQYQWRWVNNDKKPVRQVQIGKISPQTISSLYNPVVGAVVTNARTTVRKAMGEYIIKDVTEPDWLVELYINNSLVDFTHADASGFFIFKVPLVYGYTTLLLRFYGPMGEERSETRTINVPYSFLPAGELEYRMSGGFLEDGNNSSFGRAESTLGVTRFLTLGAGVEYMSSVKSGSTIPFITASFLPMSKLMLFGEYDHGVRLRGLLDYYPGASSVFEIEYTRYAKNQQAILYNYIEEKKASFSLPLKVRSTSGFMRLGYKQNVYSNFKYNMTELLLSGYYKNFNANVSAYANWINGKKSYMNSMAAISYRMKHAVTLRASAQVNITEGRILSYKAEAEKRLTHNGNISVSYERYLAPKFSSVNINFKYDLPFAQTSASARAGNHETSTFQSARGSVAFGKKVKGTVTSELSLVGRGGITVVPFVDENHNGVFDKNEPAVENLRVKINGGRVIYNDKDSSINIIGLEPFISYDLQLDDKDFENIAWRIKDKTFKVLIDPNQFKIINVPVIPVGEASGIVSIERDSMITGIGRILINFFDKSGGKIAETITEPDGYFSYLGLEPGEYTAEIDSLQLSRLNLISVPSEVLFKINATGDGDIVDDINLLLKRVLQDNQSDSAKIAPKAAIESETVAADTVDSERSTNAVNVKAITDSVIVSDNTREEADDESESIDMNTEHYYIQTGAFHSLSKARKLASDIAALVSFPSGIVSEDGFFKVRIGYFNDKAAAEECRKALKEKDLTAFTGQSQLYFYPKGMAFRTGPWYVGVGAFMYKSNAVDFIRKSRKASSYPAGIVFEEGLFKVRFGYFETKAEAIECSEKLKESGLKTITGESDNYVLSGSLVPVIK